MRGRLSNGIILALCYLMFLEGLSWWTASAPFPCLIKVEHGQQAADHDKKEQCPTFGAGSVVLLARLDHFIESHDKSIVAGFTVVLAISTIGLWLATMRLWRAGERQMELIAASGKQQSSDMQASIAAAKKTADAAQKAAVGGERLAEIADKQLSISGQQTDIQEKQHAIGRLQFVANKRPRLRIRHVVINPDIRNKLSDESTIVTGRLVVVNVGGTEARIVQSRCRVFWSPDGLPMDMDFDEGGGSFELITTDVASPITGGQSCSYPFFATERLGQGAGGIETGSWQLYVIGYVQYADIGGIERFMVPPTLSLLLMAPDACT